MGALETLTSTPFVPAGPQPSALGDLTSKPYVASAGATPATPTKTPSALEKLTSTPFKPTEEPSPYFQAKDPATGAFLGISDQKDTSGKPLFAYQLPGEGTTTDKTRVATTFDPRVAQPLSPSHIQNARMPSSVSAPIKKALGGNYSDELDHSIALELSGSNQPENLRIEHGRAAGESHQFDTEENQLAHQVATGKMSLFDAQYKLASDKAAAGDKNAVPFVDKPTAHATLQQEFDKQMQGGNTETSSEAVDTGAWNPSDLVNPVAIGKAMAQTDLSFTADAVNALSLTALGQKLGLKPGGYTGTMHTEGDGLMKGLVEGNPDEATRIIQVQDAIQKSPFAKAHGLAGKNSSLFLAAAGTLGLDELNFFPFGGETKAFGQLVGETDASKIPSILVKMGVHPDLATQYAGDFAKMTTTGEVKDALTNLNQLQKTTKLAGARVADTAVHPATVEAEQMVAKDKPGLVNQYIKKNGNIVSTDLARELFPAYQKDRSLSGAVHEPASEVTGAVYDKLLEENKGKGNNTVLITAGGTGAGKTSALRSMEVNSNEYSVVYDRNHASPSKIQKALDNGYDVHVHYTHNDVHTSLHNAMGRATRMEQAAGSGRTVPLSEHSATHIKAPVEFTKARRAFQDDPRVSFFLSDNVGNPAKPPLVPEDKHIDFLTKNGYTGGNEERLRQQVQAAHSRGDISVQTARGFDQSENARGTGASQPTPGQATGGPHSGGKEGAEILRQPVVKPEISDSLAQEAQKYGSAEEFVDFYSKNVDKIPTTPEYQKYLQEQKAFTKRETSIYAEMKAMRDKYAGKTINEVPPKDVTKYENLQKELSQSLSKKTLAHSPEGVIKTHIGEKALRSQLADFYNEVTTPRIPRAETTTAPPLRETSEGVPRETPRSTPQAVPSENALPRSTATTHGAEPFPSGHSYDPIIAEHNGGVEPPINKGEMQPPAIDWSLGKDKAAIRLSTDTMERNVEKIFPKETASKINTFLVEAVRNNETERVAFVSNLRKEIKTNIVDTFGIHAGSLDSELVQRYGENRMNLTELKKASPKNWSNIVKTSDYFRAKYNKLLDKWNEVRTSHGMAPIPKRADYFRHFQDINAFERIFGFNFTRPELPTAISGITEYFRSRAPWASASLRRLGGPFRDDALKGMDNYLDSTSRAIFHTDSVQRGRLIEKYLRQAAEANAKTIHPKIVLPNFASNLNDYVNLVSGKQAKLDRAIESVVGRNALAFLRATSRQFGLNVIGGNISAAITHMIPVAFTLATVDMKAATMGALDTLRAPFLGDFRQVGGIESKFLTRRFGTSEIERTLGEKVGNVISMPFHWADEFISRFAVSAKFNEALQHGFSPEEAMKEADNYSTRVIGDRSIGNLPNLMNTKTLGMITQFQIEVNDNLHVLLHDVPHWAGGDPKKIATAFVKFAVFSYLFNQLMQNVKGSGKGLDPIDLGLTLAGLNDEGAGQDFLHRLGLAGTDLAKELPFSSIPTGGQIPALAPLGQSAKDFMAGNYGKAAGGVLASYASPVGGGVQAQKTFQGIQAYLQGHTTDASGKVVAQIPQTPTNLVKGALFGKSAFPDVKKTKTEIQKLDTIIKQQQATGKAANATAATLAQQLIDLSQAGGNDTAHAQFDALLAKDPDMARRVGVAVKGIKAGITKEDVLIKSLGIKNGTRARYIKDKLDALKTSDEKNAYWNSLLGKKLVNQAILDQIKASP